MKLAFIAVGVVCLVNGGMLSGGETSSDPTVISLYQLEHKPPKQAHDLFVRGQRQMDAHAFQASLALFEKALKLDPKYWAAENDVGFVYLVLRDNAKAENAFQRAIDIDPENALGYANMGVSALGLQNFELAERSAHQALRYAPRMARAKAILAIIQIEQGKWTKEAHKLLEETTESLPALSNVLRMWPKGDAPAPRVVVLTSSFAQ